MQDLIPILFSSLLLPKHDGAISYLRQLPHSFFLLSVRPYGETGQFVQGVCDSQAVSRWISDPSSHHYCPKSTMLQCHTSKSATDFVKNNII